MGSVRHWYQARFCLLLVGISRSRGIDHYVDGQEDAIACTLYVGYHAVAMAWLTLLDVKGTWAKTSQIRRSAGL
jgi:hypothetical protein